MFRNQFPRKQIPPINPDPDYRQAGAMSEDDKMGPPSQANFIYTTTYRLPTNPLLGGID
jgi:hypothetical protein